LGVGELKESLMPHDPRQSPKSRKRSPAAPDPRFVGVPGNVDPNRFEDGAEPQLDWDDPTAEAAHGANHAERAIKAEASQGPKTRARNHEIVSGRPFSR
jgi:hypothetical protein